MYMASEDLHVFYHQVHKNVARRLAIEDCEWKSTQELSDEIQRSNSRVASRLKDCLEAYEHWFEVHERFEATRSAGNLTADQKDRLIKAVENRDSTRGALLEELANL